MHISATEAKNRFGSICALAKREPVFVEKAGQVDTVILSAEQYRVLQANQNKARARYQRGQGFGPPDSFADEPETLSVSGCIFHQVLQQTKRARYALRALSKQRQGAINNRAFSVTTNQE